ncbi:hypothetical protein KNE206_44620 [Kitasatospora sp. NE20-6]
MAAWTRTASGRNVRRGRVTGMRKVVLAGGVGGVRKCRLCRLAVSVSLPEAAGGCGFGKSVQFRDGRVIRLGTRIRPGLTVFDLRFYGRDGWDGTRRMWLPSRAGPPLAPVAGASAGGDVCRPGRGLIRLGTESGAVLAWCSVSVVGAVTCAVTAGTAGTATRGVGQPLLTVPLAVLVAVLLPVAGCTVGQ